jgi:enoyl-CoA hydratase/carnithine racemase
VQPIVFSTDGDVGLITLNSAARGNTLTPEVLGLLAEAITASIDEPAVRIVVLRSQSGPFCLGMDLDSAQAEAAGPTVEKTIALYAGILTAILTSPKPFLCIVSGEVKAGGIGLVSACDIVVATPAATFQLSEVFWGLIPANVIPFLCCLRMPPQKVKYLVLTGKTLRAEEAKALQLVDEVFPEDRCEKEIRTLIKNLLRANGSALSDAKKFINESYAAECVPMTERARQRCVERMRSPEVIAAMTAFNRGEAPSWFTSHMPSGSLCGGTTP